MGEPIARENANPALKSPETTATASPFLMSNSGSESAFAHSRSFITPATPFIAIPSAPITTPVITTSPPAVENMPAKVPETIGGIMDAEYRACPERNRHPEPEPEVAHREPVGDVAEAPHSPEQRGQKQHARVGARYGLGPRGYCDCRNNHRRDEHATIPMTIHATSHRHFLTNLMGT